MLLLGRLDASRADGRELVRPFLQPISFSNGFSVMNGKNKRIVKQVLCEAADTVHFFDLSDAQRLNWMIARAYELGQASVKVRRVRKSGAADSNELPVELVIRLRKPAKPKTPS